MIFKVRDARKLPEDNRTLEFEETAEGISIILSDGDESQCFGEFVVAIEDWVRITEGMC